MTDRNLMADVLREVAECLVVTQSGEREVVDARTHEYLINRAAYLDSHRERAAAPDAPVHPYKDPQQHAYTASLYKPGRCTFCGMDEGLHGPTAPPTPSASEQQWDAEKWLIEQQGLNPNNYDVEGWLRIVKRTKAAYTAGQRSRSRP